MDKKDILALCLVVACVGAVFFIIADKLSNEDLSTIEETTGFDNPRPFWHIIATTLVVSLCLFFVIKLVETARETKYDP
jgi:TRAP-type C4-dicarboxylate transport system permease small subunit